MVGAPDEGLEKVGVEVAGLFREILPARHEAWLRVGALMNSAVKKLLKRITPQPVRIARLRRKAERVLCDWDPILSQGAEGVSWTAISEKLKADDDVPCVLIATTVGGHLAAIQFDALIAVALTLRGVRVEFLLCDEALPACMADQHDWYVKRGNFLNAELKRSICETCWPVGEKYLKSLGLTVHRLSSLVSPQEREQAYAAAAEVDLGRVAEWKFRDLAVGEHGLAGALRFHARSDLKGEPDGDKVLRKYLQAGAVTAIAADNLAARSSFRTLIAHHGIYIPQGIWVAAARKAGRQVVTWNPGYKTNSFVLSQGDTYHKTMIDEPTELWENHALSDEERERLLRYLRARRTGSADWISFGSGSISEFGQHMKALRLDPAKPTIGLLTSVAWDAQLHYESNAFRDQMEWLDASISHFRQREDVNLIVRIHPAEITGFIPSQQRAVDHIHKTQGALPSHIAIVGPENPLNTYELMDGCDSVLIYSTKTGIELSAIGTPVVVAGEAWIRNKGFSIDASDQTQYEEILKSLPLNKRLSEEDQKRAERYAFHFFFRRMVELPGFQKHAGWPPYRTNLTDLEMLAPGRDKNLDLVCREIIEGGPFIAAV